LPEAPSANSLYAAASRPEELAGLIAPLRPADVAALVNELEPSQASKVLAALPFDVAVDVLNEPELERRQPIVQRMDRGVAGALIAAMAPDRRADLLRELSPAKRRAVLATIDEPDRTILQSLLAFPEGSVGSIMTTEFVSVGANSTVADAVERVRILAPDVTAVYAVYVLDPVTRVLERSIQLQDLLLADRDAPIMSVGDARKPLSASPTTSQEDAARLISKYNLVALPVVDANGKMLGAATVDDVIDAMVREATEDVQRFGGVEALDAPYLRISFAAMVRKRAGWLAALFLGEMLTATAMGYFQDEIARAVVLALFIPLIISSGGNSGSQATSLVIRALALRELTLRDWWRVAVRELPTGLTLGAILGAIGVIRILIWQRLGWYNYGPDHNLIAATIGVSLAGVVTFGSMAGSMLPFLLRRLGFDPASASAPFVATLVDVTGLIIYFSVAYAILRGTLL
ncbi:MAG TPA: magnesium transporter, partial [Gemmatimonadaceae bacterium]